jgi:hypothetical protein
MAGKDTLLILPARYFLGGIGSGLSLSVRR